MAHLCLVTGGSRSGKSAYAQRYAEARDAPHAYLATSQILDDEMRARIEKHQAQRDPDLWHATIEEPFTLADAIDKSHGSATILIDCLTLWTSNLMLQAEEQNRALTETEIVEACETVLAAARRHPGTIIFVTNEVGSGIVPENRMARQFRDLAGRVNQTIAAEVDEAYMLTCGLPVRLK